MRGRDDYDPLDCGGGRRGLCRPGPWLQDWCGKPNPTLTADGMFQSLLNSIFRRLSSPSLKIFETVFSGAA